MRHADAPSWSGALLNALTCLNFHCRSEPLTLQWAKEPQEPHGFARHHQSRHPVRRAAGARRHSVEPGRVALRRAAAARLSGRRHAGRRGGAGRRQVRRRADGLHRGLRRARADPVRRRAAHPLRHVPQRARAFAHARDRRRSADLGADRAGRALHARPRLDRVAAGRFGGRLHRRGRGLLPHPRARPAAAPARRSDARDRIGHQ